MSSTKRESEPERSGGAPLGLFDTTNLVIGAVVGADVYVIAARGAQLLGPAAVVAWVVGGVMAVAISMAMAQCALLMPRVGGSYAYARETLGPIPGFVVGWCFYLGEVTTTAVFPLAFTRYLGAVAPGVTGPWEVPTMLAFVVFVTATNYVGARTAGLVNNVLTIGKLLPLALIVALGLPWIALNPTDVVARITPFAPFGWGAFGPALAVVFWAYAGFEVAPLPAGEIREPSRTLPLALWWGMLLVTALYVLLSVVAVATLSTAELAQSATPLIGVTVVLFAGISLPASAAVTVVVVGAVLAISGVQESMTLGTSRLAYQLALDGYFPRPLAHISRRFGTPDVAIVVQGAATFLLALVGSLEALIVVSIFYLSLVYLASSVAAYRLLAGSHERRLEIPLARLIWPVAVASSVALLIASAPGAGLAALLGLLAAVLIALGVAWRRRAG